MLLKARNVLHLFVTFSIYFYLFLPHPFFCLYVTHFVFYARTKSLRQLLSNVKYLQLHENKYNMDLL